MTTDELRNRFLSEIDRRGINDKYIDGIEERELLQIGVQHGFTLEQARTFLVEACRERGYVIEAQVVQRIRDSLRRQDGIDRRDFERLVRETLPAVAGTTRTENDLRRLVLTTLDDGGARIRRGWFSDWYARAKREVGA